MILRRPLVLFSSLVTATALSVGCGDDDKGTTTGTNPAQASDASASSRDGAAGSATADAGTGTMRDAASNTLLDAALNTDASSSASDAGLPAADYAKAENWLCRPDRATDACDVNLDTTVVKADGSLQVEKFTAATDPAIDCFYVYPTVSLDPTANSDLVPGDEENSVVRAQFARLAQQCRLFAPMYRQVTLTSLRASIAGQPSTADRALGYRDVVAAWRWYLQNENRGRGIVLIGHSQGSSVLTQLIRDEVDPDPSKTPLLAAFLAGTNVTVPTGQVVGGTFQKVPLCTKADQLACVIPYVSFRTNAPPPSTASFGRTMTAGQTVACVNPASPAGGPAELHAYLSTAGAGASGLPMPAWVNSTDPAKMVTTPFVSVPGMLTGECKSDQNGSYIAVTVKGDPADPRVDDIVGDVVTNGQLQADWGLHLIDVHLQMGSILDLVAAKTKAFEKR